MAKGFYLLCVLYPRSYIHPCAFVKVDNQNFQDFGISTGKRRACTYYNSQDTCGGPRDPLGLDQMEGVTNLFTSVTSNTGPLNGQSINRQRAETLMTVTGWIRGSFVSNAPLSVL